MIAPVISRRWGFRQTLNPKTLGPHIEAKSQDFLNFGFGSNQRCVCA
jgi:hypothetical protein